ncbi:MAG: DctP family TRAP transporter solute-binding subunit [Gammaproteobacteria bacterium]|nr:DctP family TRAP transporter solute-binding subunit [Gammaproteobacteria bacterium]
MTGNYQRKLAFAFIAVFAVAVAVAFSGQALAAKKLMFAHVYEVGHPLHKGALMAAELFKERTNGRYDMRVFPASSLGKENALNESLSLGIVDVIYTGAGFAGSIYGPISITDFPFTLRGIDHWKAYRDSGLFKELAQGFSRASGGNEVMAISYYGTRHVTANKPILSPIDMKNLKIRVPNAPAYVLFPKAVGANPTPMAFAEVYLALQQGVVDAQENPLLTIQAKRLFEVQSHISLTAHITNSTLTVVSGYRLSQMTGEDRAILFDVLREASYWVTEQVIQTEQKLVQWFRDRNVEVVEVDRAPFIAVVEPALMGGSMPFSKEVLLRLQAIEE